MNLVKKNYGSLIVYTREWGLTRMLNNKDIIYNLQYPILLLNITHLQQLNDTRLL